jgi:hypothetical protein
LDDETKGSPSGIGWPVAEYAGVVEYLRVIGHAIFFERW